MRIHVAGLSLQTLVNDLNLGSHRKLVKMLMFREIFNKNRYSGTAIVSSGLESAYPNWKLPFSINKNTEGPATRSVYITQIIRTHKMSFKIHTKCRVTNYI